ncbi:hypothetical protein HK405_006294 [Cladochytrium tenue]|nr:hypothetical protein HK405_006294 [Cladochytrium tenue]
MQALFDQGPSAQQQQLLQLNAQQQPHPALLAVALASTQGPGSNSGMGVGGFPEALQHPHQLHHHPGLYISSQQVHPGPALPSMHMELLQPQDPTVSLIQHPPRAIRVADTDISATLVIVLALSGEYLPSASRACYRCGAIDHLSRECPQREGVLQPTPNGGATSPVPTCFHCGEPGHIARECPAKLSLIVGSTAAAAQARSARQQVPQPLHHLAQQQQQQHLRPAADVSAAARPAHLICHACGGAGHFARECPTASRMMGGRMVALGGRPVVHPLPPAPAMRVPAVPPYGLVRPGMMHNFHGHPSAAVAALICLRCGTAGHISRTMAPSSRALLAAAAAAANASKQLQQRPASAAATVLYSTAVSSATQAASASDTPSSAARQAHASPVAGRSSTAAGLNVSPGTAAAALVAGAVLYQISKEFH